MENCVYDFHGDDIAALKADNGDGDMIPKSVRATAVGAEMERLANIFAVVCDESNQRVYPWGTLRVDDNEHSDFRRLQTILFENGT